MWNWYLNVNCWMEVFNRIRKFLILHFLREKKYLLFLPSAIQKNNWTSFGRSMMGNEICIVIKTIYKLKDVKWHFGIYCLRTKNQPRLSLDSGIFPTMFPCWWLATFLLNMRSRKATNAFGTGHNWFKSWLSMLGIFSPTCLWQIICPFYHCRLAMLAILFAPRGTYIKQYFALLGVLGSIAALVYPAFDPLPIPPYYCAQSDF